MLGGVREDFSYAAIAKATNPGRIPDTFVEEGQAVPTMVWQTLLCHITLLAYAATSRRAARMWFAR
jgi:hypothetical protein